VIVPHPLDLIAVLLGIFLALRRSDVRGEELSFHPNVSAVDFELWRRRAVFAYTLGTRACFAKVLVDFAFLALLRRVSMELSVQRVLGAALDLAWVAAMIACWVLARRARKLAESVGIRITAANHAQSAVPARPPSESED
jgi:hypothetical protein